MSFSAEVYVLRHCTPSASNKANRERPLSESGSNPAGVEQKRKMPDEPIIQVESLRRTYTHVRRTPGLWGALKSFVHRETVEMVAVKGISFEIQRGEFVGFIGPNGAGKTTTMKMLSGVLHPSAGRAQVIGFTPHERRPQFLKQIAFVMGQKGSLFWELPAMELFLLMRDIYGVPQRDFDRSLELLTRLLDAADFLDVQVRLLSLGQRMKCELISGLLHMPRVLFLDEPTIGLDVASQKMIREFFRRYNQETGATIVLTSHYLEDIKSLCQRIIFIDAGTILFDGPLAEIMGRFAPDVRISLVFDESEQVTEQELRSLGTPELDQESGALGLRVRRDLVADVARELLNRYRLSNILVEEPSLEEVVTALVQHHAE